MPAYVFLEPTIDISSPGAYTFIDPGVIDFLSEIAQLYIGGHTADQASISLHISSDVFLIVAMEILTRHSDLEVKS